MNCQTIAPKLRRAAYCWVLLVLTFYSTHVSSAEYALVIGIDQYQHGSNDPNNQQVLNLMGAENDARLIAKTLRNVGVDLPDSRLLLGDKATLKGFHDAWNAMLSVSKPGDNLILSYAGHGGQEEEFSEPKDEVDADGEGDHLDETLMFWDFDPQQPQKGRLLDDELYTLLRDADDRQILFVADSCHSGGLSRSLDKKVGRSRAGGRYKISVSLDGIDDIVVSADEGENWQKLPHVTYLMATDDEARTVDEIKFEGQFHGALSVAFAEGITGGADYNHDNIVLRRELQDYVLERVKKLTDSKQSADFLPRGGSTADKTLATLNIQSPSVSANPMELASAPLKVAVEGGQLPRGLNGAIQDETANLSIVFKEGEAIAYYNSDELTRWPHNSDKVSLDSIQHFQKLVDKFRLLNAIDSSYINTLPPMIVNEVCDNFVSTENCGRERWIGNAERDITGDQFDFVFSPSDEEASGSYLVILNIAGDGQMQMQYPLFSTDPSSISASEWPYTLSFNAAAPAGRDDMVASLCKDDPVELKKLYNASEGLNAPDPVKVVQLLSASRCQSGRIAYFTTAEKP